MGLVRQPEVMNTASARLRGEQCREAAEARGREYVLTDERACGLHYFLRVGAKIRVVRGLRDNTGEDRRVGAHVNFWAAERYR